MVAALRKVHSCGPSHHRETQGGDEDENQDEDVGRILGAMTVAVVWQPPVSGKKTILNKEGFPAATDDTDGLSGRRSLADFSYGACKSPRRRCDEHRRGGDL
ncbi:hypothetical protein E4U53_003892, partial [Claviceps sorghi]